MVGKVEAILASGSRGDKRGGTAMIISGGDVGSCEIVDPSNRMGRSEVSLASNDDRD